MEKFLAIYDVHYGYQRKGGHKSALHDRKAVSSMLAFAKDFRPHHLILGGDILDCGSISHHRRGKPGETEGLKLKVDAEECYENVIAPLEALGCKSMTYIMGNHEDWVQQFIDETPALEGVFNVATLLHLNEKKWKIIPQGGYHKLGKLYFIHGDQISGGANAAYNAVVAYEESVRLGHFHTYQAATKTTHVGGKTGKTGIVVPCLCKKDPAYNKGRPNKWMQGFNYGYVGADGTFRDYIAIIVDGKCVVNGRKYEG